MKLDIFTEVQKRDCDGNGGFRQLFDETIAQAEAADRAGFHCWWQVEHHCTPDFSYSSCPEMILQVIAVNTGRMRIGHAGILAPFKINHPLRAAERAALLDHLSGGRLEVGLAKSGGREWETFEVSEEAAAEELVELTEMLPRAWRDEDFCWQGEHWSVNARNVLPKPLQDPHPAIWHTCSSPPSFERAGSMGVGVLATTLFAPLDALASMLQAYRTAIAEFDPNGRAINAQAGVATFVHVASTDKEAIESGAPRSALWYVSSAPRIFNVPREIFYQAIRGQTDPRSRPSTAPLPEREVPDATDTSDPNPVVSLMKREFAGEEISNEEIFETIRHLDSVIVGDVQTCKRKMSRYREIGMDRLMCLVQMGEVPHEAVMKTTRLIGKELIPWFDAAAR